MDGSIGFAIVTAFFAGLLSFLSPCVLPLVPGYLSYVAGLVGTGAPAAAVPAGPGGTATAVRTDSRSPRGRMVLGSVLFVLGFSLVFVTFATAFGGLGRLMLQHAVLLDRIFGVVTVNSLEQALARAEDGTTNKGYESAVAAVTMANLRRKLAE